MSTKEEEIYRFQLILNYLNKEERHGKLLFIHKELNLTSDFEETVTKTLRNVLVMKKIKSENDQPGEIERTSGFVQK